MKNLISIPGTLAVTTILAGLVLVGGTKLVYPHTAPSGEFVYPPGCCHSAATNPNGDCAPIPDGTVTAHSDGWHITLAIGQHPKLKTKGYTAVIPYAQAKYADDGEFHICLSNDGAVRYCFFAPPPGS
jgi:hypothetical protein